MTADILADLVRLQTENARLKAILQQHGITWDVPLPSAPVLDDVLASNSPINYTHPLSAADKITLFRRLFRGRTDVYPQRWESQKVEGKILTVRSTMRSRAIRIFGAGYWSKGKVRYEKNTILDDMYYTDAPRDVNEAFDRAVEIKADFLSPPDELAKASVKKPSRSGWTA